MEIEAPEQCWEGEEDGEVGDVVDETVGENRSGRLLARGDDDDEEEVSEAGAVGHHQRADGGAFETLAEQRLEAQSMTRDAARNSAR